MRQIKKAGSLSKAAVTGIILSAALLCGGCDRDQIHEMNPISTMADMILGESAPEIKMVVTDWGTFREDLITGRSRMPKVTPLDTNNAVVTTFRDIQLGESGSEVARRMLNVGNLKITSWGPASPHTYKEIFSYISEDNGKFKFESPDIMWDFSTTYAEANGDHADFFEIFYQNGKVGGKHALNAPLDRPNRANYLCNLKNTINKKTVKQIKEGDDYRDVVKLFGVDGFPQWVFLSADKHELFAEMEWWYYDINSGKKNCIEIKFNNKGKVINTPTVSMR